MVAQPLPSCVTLAVSLLQDSTCLSVKWVIRWTSQDPGADRHKAVRAWYRAPVPQMRAAVRGYRHHRFIIKGAIAVPA